MVMPHRLLKSGSHPSQGPAEYDHRNSDTAHVIGGQSLPAGRTRTGPARNAERAGARLRAARGAASARRAVAADVRRHPHPARGVAHRPASRARTRLSRTAGSIRRLTGIDSGGASATTTTGSPPVRRASVIAAIRTR